MSQLQGDFADEKLEKIYWSRGRKSQLVGGWIPYVVIYKIDIISQPRSLGIALSRGEKFSAIVRSQFSRDCPQSDTSNWAIRSAEILHEIIPTLEPPNLPTHFLSIGLYNDSGLHPFLKVPLALNNGKLCPDDCADSLGTFLQWYFSSRVKITIEIFDSPQEWVLHCLVTKWQNLRRT